MHLCLAREAAKCTRENDLVVIAQKRIAPRFFLGGTIAKPIFIEQLFPMHALTGPRGRLRTVRAGDGRDRCLWCRRRCDGHCEKSRIWSSRRRRLAIPTPNARQTACTRRFASRAANGIRESRAHRRG